jgi:hypothetical protein
MVSRPIARGSYASRAGSWPTLYSAIAAWAEARGALDMRLAVLEVNAAGERFWRALGFEEIRRVGPDRFQERWHRRVELSRSMAGRFPERDALT